MAKKSFLPKDDEGKAFWLSNFAAKLPTYNSKYGITAAQVTDMIDSEQNFAYWMNVKEIFREFQTKLTAYKNEMRDGVAPGASPSIVPTVPTLSPLPPVVAPGIFVRASAIGSGIKVHSDYSVSDGQDLGLEGAEEIVDLPNMKPLLQIMLTGGVPRIKWKKQGLDAIELHVMRNGTPYTFLAIDTIPDYDDTFQLPAAGQSEVWKYKAIYRYKDERVGQWSDEVSVTVMG